MKMITGDLQETAIAVAKNLNIFEVHSEAQISLSYRFIERMFYVFQDGVHQSISGAEMDAMSDSELARVIDGISVFYRTTPRHKLKIVHALQSTGKVREVL